MYKNTGFKHPYMLPGSEKIKYRTKYAFFDDGAMMLYKAT